MRPQTNIDLLLTSFADAADEKRVYMKAEMMV
jgi:hypothetical protein